MIGALDLVSRLPSPRSCQSRRHGNAAPRVRRLKVDRSSGQLGGAAPRARIVGPVLALTVARSDLTALRDQARRRSSAARGESRK